MTALPLRDFTDAERAKLAAIEAAPAAAEAVRERVARAMYEADPDWTLNGETIPWEVMTVVHDDLLRAADAALAVLSGPSPTLSRPNSNGQVHARGNCPECGRRIATRNGKIMYHYRAGYVSECTGKGRAAVADDV